MESATIWPATGHEHAGRLVEFMKFGEEIERSWTTSTKLDKLLCLFLDAKCREWAPATAGSKFLAVLAVALPQYRRRPATALPRSTRGLKGGRRRAPLRQRLPLPSVLLCYPLGRLLEQGIVGRT